MNNTTFSTRVCACCKRELSFENFYYNHRTQIFDKYCKECRKKRSRQYRKECRHTEKNRKRLIITEIDDSLLRMELILRALERYALVSCGSGKRYRNPNTAISAITMYLFKNRNRFNGFVNMVHKNKTYDLPLHCHQA